MNHHYPPWNKPEKVEARRIVISICKSILGYDYIPADKEYITICGQCTDKNGQFLIDCEPDQLIKMGFIRPNQYVGVDINKDVINANYQARPNLKWICGDFCEVINNRLYNRKYKAEVIHFDWIEMPVEGVKKLSKLLSLISGTDTKIVICNFMLNSPYNGDLEESPDKIIYELESNDLFQFSVRNDGWKHFPQAYLYSTKMKTLMETIILYKQ